MNAYSSPDESMRKAIGKLSHLTGEICTFFGSHGPYNIFFSENRGFPSYNSIEGSKPVPWSYQEEGFPVSNQEKKDETKAIEECRKLGRKIFDLESDEKITSIQRNYMVDGNTVPIKITYGIDCPEEDLEQSIYVKKMNLNRLFLGTLYNLMIGREFTQFFSESTIFKWEEVGPTLEDAYLDSSGFFQDITNRRNLVKLSAQAYFLSLTDADYGWNVVANNEHGFVPIDFDHGFWFKIPHPLEELVNPIMNPLFFEMGGDFVQERVPMEKILRQFQDGEIEHYTQEAFHEIHENLSRRIDTFQGIIELMSRFDYYNIMSQRMYGARDAKDYFMKRLEEIK